MTPVRWIEELPKLDLGDRVGGSEACLGPESERETELPGFGRRTPQAFLAQFRPNFKLNVHFHRVDQFQWFIGGGCCLGAHNVTPGTVHYADRYTPYGPLSAGAEGAEFLTLRTTTDTGAHFMPESRTTLGKELRSPGSIEPSRRNQTWHLLGCSTTECGQWCDLCYDPDELRVSVADLHQGQPLISTGIRGAGAYLAVVAGQIKTRSSVIEAGGFCAIESGETPAGQTGHACRS
jgi:hypothetical protein